MKCILTVRSFQMKQLPLNYKLGKTIIEKISLSNSAIHMHMIPPLLMYESSFTTVIGIVFFFNFPLVMTLHSVVCEQDQFRMVQEINETHKYDEHVKHQWANQFSAIQAAYMLLVWAVFAVTMKVHINAALLRFEILPQQ